MLPVVLEGVKIRVQMHSCCFIPKLKLILIDANGNPQTLVVV